MPHNAPPNYIPPEDAPPNNLLPNNLPPDNLPPNNLDLAVVLSLSFGLLLASALTGTFIAYPLLAALAMLIAALLKRGFALFALLKMAFAGAKQALPVVYILLLISVLTAVWMASGTVPALVYYGTQLISPRFFILWAFLLSSGISTLIGTSFGTVGTIGVALIVIARSSHIAVDPVAGAIIAGAFVGDRCSPLSSSAHLVASITRTNLYANLRNMVASSLWPLALSIAFYTALSLHQPQLTTQIANSTITTELPKVFNLSLITLLPAAVILLLAVLRVNVKLAMLASIGIGTAIAHTLQQVPLLSIIQFSLFGYHQDNPLLQNVLLGGGFLPMAKATITVFTSTAFAGIFSGSRTLSFAHGWLKHIRTYRQLSRATVFMSLFSNLFGCTQTIGILLTEQIMRPHYQHHYPDRANQQLALAIEDTATVVAPLIPWNIAGLIPATVLAVGPGFIPYMAYLLLLPLFVVLRRRSPIGAF
ncbi:MAG: Na+/H+ antiporter NhaC family protein [Phormidesmis sp.]